MQEALTVRASEDVEGAWNWVSDTKAQYRTKEYWPSRTRVSVTADLAGVQAGADVWGDQDKQVDFQIGKSVVSVVDVTDHQMTVTIDGQVARTIPVTTGKDGFLTRGGTRVISEKLEDIRMDAASTGITPGDPEYYNLDVRYALRMTNSGEFIRRRPLVGRLAGDVQRQPWVRRDERRERTVAVRATHASVTWSPSCTRTGRWNPATG